MQELSKQSKHRPCNGTLTCARPRSSGKVNNTPVVVVLVRTLATIVSLADSRPCGGTKRADG